MPEASTVPPLSAEQRAEAVEATPEQIARAAAERDPSPRYADGRPKMHRHFAEFAVHTDEECTKASTRRRVYVFDADVLDEYDAHIRADERAKAWDVVVGIRAAMNPRRIARSSAADTDNRGQE